MATIGGVPVGAIVEEEERRRAISLNERLLATPVEGVSSHSTLDEAAENAALGVIKFMSHYADEALRQGATFPDVDIEAAILNKDLYQKVYRVIDNCPLIYVLPSIIAYEDGSPREFTTLTVTHAGEGQWQAIIPATQKYLDCRMLDSEKSRMLPTDTKILLIKEDLFLRIKDIAYPEAAESSRRYVQQIITDGDIRADSDRTCSFICVACVCVTVIGGAIGGLVAFIDANSK